MFQFTNWKKICEEKDAEIAKLKQEKDDLNEVIKSLLEGVIEDCSTLIANDTHKKS